MNLVTDRCILRGPTLGDVASLAIHANNRKVWRNLRDSFPHPYTTADAERWVDSIANETPRVTFMIDVGGVAVGSVGLDIGKDIERVSAEVGYWLGEEYWGRGITSAAVAAVSTYGLTELGLARIFAVPIVWNPASFRVLEKSGFVREGILRKACIKDGEVMDMAMYARTCKT